MSIEDQIFKRKHADIKKLLLYGFKEVNGKYLYSKEIQDHEFKIEIMIFNHQVIGKIYDLNFNEEYIAFRMKRVGNFASKIKEKYEMLLNDIANNCFIEDPFIFEQSNRLANLIDKKYGDQPDFKFENSPGIGVFCNPDNGKWYGIIMNIDKSKIDEGSGEVEILNVKLDPDKVLKLLDQDGFYRCYHMNKKQWITILLDNTIPDKIIMELIEESYNYTIHKKSNTNEWLIPANPKYYDLEEAFQKSNIITWKQSANIQVHNIVYIYVGKPCGSIMYQCEVLEVNIPYHYDDGILSMKKIMKLRLLQRYQQGQYPFELLKKFGVNAIRGPRYMPSKLSEEIKRRDKSESSSGD